MRETPPLAVAAFALGASMSPFAPTPEANFARYFYTVRNHNDSDIFRKGAEGHVQKHDDRHHHHSTPITAFRGSHMSISRFAMEYPFPVSFAMRSVADSAIWARKQIGFGGSRSQFHTLAPMEFGALWQRLYVIPRGSKKHYLNGNGGYETNCCSSLLSCFRICRMRRGRCHL